MPHVRSSRANPRTYLLLSILCFTLAIACLVLLFGGVAGCSANQAAQGADTVAKIQAATTQPYVTVPAEALGPYGQLALGVVTLALAGLAAFFKSQQSAGQAHLDTAQAATGTTSNAAATASLVNNLDSTVIPLPTPPPAAAPPPKPA